MTQRKADTLQTELMRAGLQLLHNAGLRIDKEETEKIVLRWARQEAGPMARRLPR